MLGSLHLERALAEGITAYEPGLLAAAHRGLLYVDEVNLLHDHLVDVLLDAAAMGRATVERDGVSVTHPARFVLVGTMNPEEGELRPQLLDRFGLTVDVVASRDPAVRVEVMRARLAYEADPAGFVARYDGPQRELAERIVKARDLITEVILTDAALRQIAEICASFDVDGMRADLVTARTAVAHAAWSGRTVVEVEDVRAAAKLALPHRRRRNPFDAPGLDEDQLEQAIHDSTPPPDPDDDPDGPAAWRGSGPAGRRQPGRRDRRTAGADGRPADPADERAEPADRGGEAGRAGRRRGAAGRRRSARSSGAPSPTRRACSACRPPAPASPGGGPGRSPRSAAWWAIAPRVGRESGRPHLLGDHPLRRAAPARARSHRRRASPYGPRTCGSPYAKAARATSCCSVSTRPARWGRRSGWAR